MVRYRFELATPDDDVQLRRILAATPMDGNISVSFRCEPSYFDAACVHGSFSQVVVCRETDTNQIVGFGCRSIRDRYVNGVPMPIGYLSSLRVLEPYRNFGLVARGYKFFGNLHADDQRTELYLTTIAQGNDRAEKILTSGRAGLPQYSFAGSYHTVAIHVPKTKTIRTHTSTAHIRSATLVDLPEVLDFLAREGLRRQFFPKYDASDFFNNEATFKNLEPSDLLLAMHGDRLVGTLAGWNQLSFRQFMVNGYQGPLHSARPLFNVFAKFRGLPQLPQPGTSFRYSTAALPLVADDDPAVFDILLDVLLQRLAPTESDYLLLGLHESDPLLPLAVRRPSTSYQTKLFLVSWHGEDRMRQELNRKTPYLELGTL